MECTYLLTKFFLILYSFKFFFFYFNYAVYDTTLEHINIIKDPEISFDKKIIQIIFVIYFL